MLTEDQVTPSEPSAEDATAFEDAVGRLVQRQLLPRTAPRIEGYDIAAGTTTEDRGRGHTVWDWMRLGDGRSAIFTYNVQGEGLPPSYDLVAVRAVLRALVREHSELNEILFKANAALSGASVGSGGRFVECGAAIPGPDGVAWSAAGRVPAGVIRRDGTFTELGSDGPPLGMMEAFRYGTRTISMGPGDVLVALTEASGGIFRGAADLVAQVHGKTAGEVVSTLHKAVRRAYGDEARETTALLIRKH